jgi:Fe-S-cluster-containing dehydrogenase component
MRWGMVINLAKCTRCHACVAACRVEHFLPLHVTWPRLIAYEVDSGTKVDVSTYPVRCNQCKDAPCAKVCPTEASHQRPDGIVAIDSDKCMGCRYCVIACPYQNRTFLSKDKDPGHFPGFPQTKFEKKGKKIYPHQRGTRNATSARRESMPARKKGSSRASTVTPLRPASIPAKREP